jgi:hypothetical protein
VEGRWPSDWRNTEMNVTEPIRRVSVVSTGQTPELASA